MTQRSTDTPLADKVALVTGASRGLGAEVARQLGALGAHVVLLARTVGGLEEVDDDIRAAGGQASLLPLDLRQFDQIDAAAAALYERFGKLDLLVGNAAVLGSLTPLGHADAKMWQQVMDVNVTANFRLIRAFDPLLRRAEAGRAVFVTSGAAHGNFAYWGAYGTSKAALEALVMIYAAEVAKTAVRVNLFDPGIMRTAMRAQAFPAEDPSLLADPAEIARRMLPLLLPECVQHAQRAAA